MIIKLPTIWKLKNTFTNNWVGWYTFKLRSYEDFVFKMYEVLKQIHRRWITTKVDKILHKPGCINM